MSRISKRTAFLRFALVVSAVPALAFQAAASGAPPTSHPTYGRSFLLPGQTEAPGYRAYSYVILASSADLADPSILRPVLSAYLALDEIGRLQAAGAEPQDLNVAYLPLAEAPPANPDPTWLLAHFDYARARNILQAAGASHRQGATLLSYAAPLSGASTGREGIGAPPMTPSLDANKLMIVDLSGNPAELTSALDKHFAAAPSPEEPVRGSYRLTGRDFLLAGKAEDSGYGLYSYLLFGEPLNDGNRALYRAILDAFSHLTEVRSFLAENKPRSDLNVTYLPLNDLPPSGAGPDWLLDHYDFARAQIILAALAQRPVGPYIVSYKSPLSAASSVETDQLLVEDLSRIPPDLAFLWVNEFSAQAGRPQYWDRPALRTLMLNLRTQIAVDAEAFEQVRSAYGNLNTALASRIKIQE